MTTFDTDDNKNRPADGVSPENHRNSPTTDSGATGVQRLQNHRDDLRDLAESDLPVSWVAEVLLEIADDVDGGGSDTDGGGGGDSGR